MKFSMFLVLCFAGVGYVRGDCTACQTPTETKICQNNECVSKENGPCTNVNQAAECIEGATCMTVQNNSVCKCDSGKVVNTNGSKCEACPAGQVPTSAGDACEACPTGQVPNSAGDACEACPTGQVPNSAGDACVGKVGTMCTTVGQDTECISGAICKTVESKTSCMCKNNSIANSNKDACLLIIGETCEQDADCIVNAECTEGKTCSCKPDYTPHANKQQCTGGAQAVVASLILLLVTFVTSRLI